MELVLMVAPEPPPGQHQQQRRGALQREEKEDHLDEDAGGRRPDQTRTEDLPTFTSQRPEDLAATTPAPAGTSRTSDLR